MLVNVALRYLSRSRQIQLQVYLSVISYDTVYNSDLCKLKKGQYSKFTQD